MSSLVNSIGNTEFGNEFMKLLMIQLQNQDPLDPVNDKEFLAQLAQFSSLAELTKLNVSFSQALQIQQLNEARGLIGQNITFRDTDSGNSLSGLVDGVKIGNNGAIMLLVSGQEVPLSNLEGVSYY
ncbi:MAG TPA: flagellar hook capping FlgD N-terminal domain-containing protein [Candidatus Brocadiia bacterium]|nr:flagellar hook capping protein [Planctomycetota bacterium]MBI4007619.1 flagellar hook capping protein [Planctomycetota bacterium]MDO8094311.1 flagellar hook capping FlgD N-terminal domain-containing protein [Candidatus Brocadiales bacterium]